MLRILAFCLALLTASGGCGPNTRKDGLHEVDARVNVKLAVEAQLKDPASASFSWAMDFKKVSEDSWTVSSYVDAKNSFGGTVRTHYTATVDRLGTVTSLKVGN